MPDFSLLHATYRAGDAAVRVRSTWFERAHRPELVEHLFAMDANDDLSLAATGRLPRVVSPPVPTVSAVRNWNAAATSAAGRVLLVIADDLTPRGGWDDALRAAIDRADPDAVPWVVIAKELGAERFWLGTRNTLIRHPIISRAHYRRFGLFDPELHGVGCDNDFTLGAFKRSLVFDVPGLVYEHANPADVPTVVPTDSHHRMYDDAEYAHYRAVAARKWPARRRVLIGRYALPEQLPVPRGRVALGAWHAACSMRKVGRVALDAVRRTG